MEATGILCIIAFFAAVAGLVLLISSAQRHSLNDSYERLARELDGDCQRATLFSSLPSVRFQYRGAGGLVDLQTSGGEHPTYFTQLQINWPQRDFRMEIYPERFLTGIAKFLGMHDIEIGAPEFDATYLITGNSEDEVRRLLTPAVKSAIEELRTFFYDDDIYLLWSNGVLLIKKRGRISEFGELRRFVALSLELFDQAIATRAEGITFVEEPTPLDTVTGVCQICGDDIQRDIVHCRSCKTPHHRDCWEYYGACSTYGCGQTKFVLSRR